MRLHFHHTHEYPQLEARLRAMERKIDLILETERCFMATMDDLKAAVARNADAEASVIALLAGVSQQLKDAAGNPAAVKEVVDQLDANTAKLAEAVVANTPAA